MQVLLTYKQMESIIMKSLTVNKFKELLNKSGIDEDKGVNVTQLVLNEQNEGETPRAPIEVKSEDKRIKKILEAYMNTDETKMRLDSYFIDGNELYYRIATKSNNEYRMKENILAKKVDGRIIGNSSALGLIGRRSHFGRESLNANETEVQRCLSVHAVMVPFNVFEEAKLSLDEFKIIDEGPEETIKRQREIIKIGRYVRKDYKPKKDEIVRNGALFIKETVHFTGAKLFSVDGSCFLFDIDRNEIKHEIFNAFLVKLPVQCSTINEAYACLKPDEVKSAEKQGLKVLRQGEWFFIPVEQDYLPTREKNWHNKMVQVPGTLQAGNNSPNTTTKFHRESGCVSGKVSHSGREHKTIMLKGWYKAVPNTAQASFTIVGDVD